MSVLSTNQSPSEVTVRRRQKDGSRTEVSCPLAIKIYNIFVGGVDKNDQLRGVLLGEDQITKVTNTSFGFSSMLR